MKKDKFLTSLVSFVFLAALTGCASMAHGRYEDIEVSSDPAGANATIVCDGVSVASGITPTTLRMARKADGCELRLTHSGFSENRMPLVRRLTNWYWPNALMAAAAAPGAAVIQSGGIGSGAVGDILLGVSAIGVAGLISDRVTGAAFNHGPARVEVTLKPQSTRQP